MTIAQNLWTPHRNTTQFLFPPALPVFKIVEVGDDFLMCSRLLAGGSSWDANIVGGVAAYYMVLKDPLLRTSVGRVAGGGFVAGINDGLHGFLQKSVLGITVTFAYDYTDPTYQYQRRYATWGTPSQTITEIVTEPYCVGDTLVAAPWPASWTDSTGVAFPGGTLWCEISGNRAWALQPPAQNIPVLG